MLVWSIAAMHDNFKAIVSSNQCKLSDLGLKHLHTLFRTKFSLLQDCLTEARESLIGL